MFLLQVFISQYFEHIIPFYSVITGLFWEITSSLMWGESGSHCMWSYSSLDAFNILFIYDYWQFDHNDSIWRFLDFMNLCVYFFPRFAKFCAIVSWNPISQYFFFLCSIWDFHNVYWFALCCSIIPVDFLYSLFFFYFYFFLLTSKFK